MNNNFGKNRIRNVENNLKDTTSLHILFDEKTTENTDIDNEIDCAIESSVKKSKKQKENEKSSKVKSNERKKVKGKIGKRSSKHLWMNMCVFIVSAIAVGIILFYAYKRWSINSCNLFGISTVRSKMCICSIIIR